MSENLRKLIGVAVMAAIVVVGVVATSGDDSDFDRTRNAAFVKLGDIKGEVKDDGAASKGGDCCDETLYRLGQIEDRLSQIETSLQQALQQVDGAQAQPIDRAGLIVAAIEELLPRGREELEIRVGAELTQSRLLIGLDIETAREVAIRLGLGFDHHSGEGSDLDGEGFWGTRLAGGGRRCQILASTENGLVRYAVQVCS